MSIDVSQSGMANSCLSGTNMTYVDSLYADYLVDPFSVSQDWRMYFNELSSSAIVSPDESKPQVIAQESSVHIDNKQYQVAKLIHAYRKQGHHAAKLDPLEMNERTHVKSLDLSFHHLSEADMNSVFFVGDHFNIPKMPLRELLKALQETYCESIGIEYMHISDNEQTLWLQQKMESAHGHPSFNSKQITAILEDLIAADGFERYLATRYVGQKRFSLEGGDSLIPLIKEVIKKAGNDGVEELVIGMAHRGRLNVLVNALGKKPHVLFEEFEGKINLERTGDVKYHLGFSSNLSTEAGSVLHVALAFNPSHLEIIDPVVEGSVRSRLRRRDNLEQKDKVVPIIIHGDAAFAGQGVVMETFNFSQARGYATGGTLHIVINNQIGFTTSNPLDARSTLYCTDVAKMVQAPIIHVNGDDPEAVVFVTQIAFEFRMRFKRDIVIDLVCYRRHGHNEADEPSVTQPLMYHKIKTMRPLREIYASKLIEKGSITQAEVDKLIEVYRVKLDKGEAIVNTVADDYIGEITNDWTPYLRAKWTDFVDTTISKTKIESLAAQLNVLPNGFELHPVVARLFSERNKMTSGELPMNWGYAEILAYASLVEEGYHVRLAGQDSGRGTFAHRHAVLHDDKTGEIYIPLEHIIPPKTKQLVKATFTVIDSVLSEEAVLAFEYGYASSEPSSLVLWEAQFGDFANGAQVVIDQFISSGEQKWGRLCGLVMLLPHGYEGQGPEHSSARLERYMQLCAQQNIQVCTPTTPAQLFHMLRRQMLRKFRKPLIVMTPKSLLRHKLATSSLNDLISGEFQTIIPEIDDLIDNKVTKVVLCCGKVYYDLLQKRRNEQRNFIAIIRIEQLYPFPKSLLKQILGKYPQAKTIIWCQEEPQNQGVWFSSQHNIQDCLQKNQTLLYIGREVAAAPAVGSPLLHAQQQQQLVEQALS